MAICGPSERCSRSRMPRVSSHQVDRPQVELLPAREGQHALRQSGAALRAPQGVVEQPR